MQPAEQLRWNVPGLHFKPAGRTLGNTAPEIAAGSHESRQDVRA